MELRQWPRGVSGNPAGRPPSFLDLAVSVRRITDDGSELIALLLAIARGEAIEVPGRNGTRAPQPQRPNLTQRMQAIQQLLDRGWGRPKEVLELASDVDPEQQHRARVARFATMDPAERDKLRDLLHRVNAIMAPLDMELRPDLPLESKDAAAPPDPA